MMLNRFMPFYLVRQ
jgi:regulator of protease activity HflC (stomatin/prohibitin superfamily)